MHVHYTCAWYLPWSEKVWMPWSWDHGERESPRELNPGPMQEQQGLALLLTTDTALHFWYSIFFFNEYLLFGTKKWGFERMAYCKKLMYLKLAKHTNVTSYFLFYFFSQL